MSWRRNWSPSLSCRWVCGTRHFSSASWLPRVAELGSGSGGDREEENATMTSRASSLYQHDRPPCSRPSNTKDPVTSTVLPTNIALSRSASAKSSPPSNSPVPSTTSITMSPPPSDRRLSIGPECTAEGFVPDPPRAAKRRKPSKAKSTSFAYGGLNLAGKAVQVVVGEGDHAQARTLPKALLCHQSSFFRAKCDAESVILLPEYDASAFELFVEFIYTGSFAQRSGACASWDKPGLQVLPAGSNGGDDEGVELVDKTGVHAWVLGDRLGSIGLKNYVMRFLFYHSTTTIQDHSTYIDPNAIMHAYENTKDGSKLRQFFLDATMRYWGDGNIIRKDLKEWEVLLDKEKEFRYPLFMALAEDSDSRMDKHLGPMKDYFEYYMDEEDATPAPTVKTEADARLQTAA
ncbi:uncharacterized protein BDZ99DRAFT_495579 [Mytilinidion resinicola]|uniref:BTB domain-containing protein n=1 Tax=Mytilinidion resinicola TaxID=574789 RepID=A0A6A6Z1F4_9PEZI|nr:uncharacterized protein BDZ99DRAFT_495579 [Mytilinidion resinicola]KAF2814005.1 hypothetical protein BDZ99DRAFT_495579 [Mytilinidion resinicola]